MSVSLTRGTCINISPKWQQANPPFFPTFLLEGVETTTAAITNPNYNTTNKTIPTTAFSSFSPLSSILLSLFFLRHFNHIFSSFPLGLGNDHPPVPLTCLYCCVPFVVVLLP